MSRCINPFYIYICGMTKSTVLKYFTLLPFLILLSLNVIAQDDDFFLKLSNAASTLTHNTVTYDPTYFSIKYPNGDVPSNKGVCTDVIIRAYRLMSIDLQKEIHLDMKANFEKYPSWKKWGLKTTDTNIDHRRVPNQQTFFSRKGITRPITQKATDYQPGDIISWDLGNGLTHIGIVINKKDPSNKRYMIVHNIGQGQVLEDCLFSWKITGHYRYQK